jgi:prepilin-type N-terminal cleavage/methylation domain-containing protein
MRSQRGFTVIEVVVVIVLLAMVGGGVYVWQQRERVDSATQTLTATPTPMPSPTPTADPYVGWQEYASTEHNFSFKYPPSWKKTTDELVGQQNKRNVIVVSSDGAQSLQINGSEFGIGCSGVDNPPPVVQRQFTLGGVQKMVGNFCYGEMYFIRAQNADNEKLQLLIALKDHKLTDAVDQVLRSIEGLTFTD